jgi:hypothetical protein
MILIVFITAANKEKQKTKFKDIFGQKTFPFDNVNIKIVASGCMLLRGSAW